MDPFSQAVANQRVNLLTGGALDRGELMDAAL